MQQTGVDLVHVPYKGGQRALLDVAAGHLDLMFAPAAVALPLIKSGKLRALAVTHGAGNSAAFGLPPWPRPDWISMFVIGTASWGRQA